MNSTQGKCITYSSSLHIDDGLAHLLLHLKPSQAPGLDAIPARLLKELLYEFAPLIVVTYKATLEQGCLPTKWKNANVVPILTNHLH